MEIDADSDHTTLQYMGLKLYSQPEDGLLSMGVTTADAAVRAYWRFPLHSDIPFMVAKQFNEARRYKIERAVLEQACHVSASLRLDTRSERFVADIC